MWIYATFFLVLVLGVLLERRLELSVDIEKKIIRFFKKILGRNKE